ncbi:MAG: transposase [Acidobacteria bacterium]|nr:transposase [Acidobacteriota bacterium]
MARGNRKQSIFDDDDDRRRLLSIVETTTVRYAVRCYAYCLMSNHYHLVLETPIRNLSSAMRYINGVYAQAVNRRHRRTGHVFEGRFCSLLVDSDSYLRDLVRYVVLNPVRARLASDAGAWAWSSYRATAGIDRPPRGLCLDWLDCAFGGTTRAEAQLKFQLFVNDVLTDHTAMADDEAVAWGSPEFRSTVGDALVADVEADHSALTPLPRSVRALARPSLAELFAEQPATLRDRDHLIRESHTRHGYRLAEIAAHLGLHPSTASLAMRREGASRG